MFMRSWANGRARTATISAGEREPRFPEKNHYRVVIMGAGGVGKTAIINRLLYEQFISEYKATVEDLYCGEYLCNGVAVTLDFLDTAGSYAFPAMRRLSIATADAFILVYSVDDEDSFDEVKRLRQQITSARHDTLMPIVIVGNKSDVSETARRVTRGLAETTAAIDWGNGYVEVSAKSNINLDGIFRELLHQAKKQWLAKAEAVSDGEAAPEGKEAEAPRRRDSSSLFMDAAAKAKRKRDRRKDNCVIA